MPGSLHPVRQILRRHTAGMLVTPDGVAPAELQMRLRLHPRLNAHIAVISEPLFHYSIRYQERRICLPQLSAKLERRVASLLQLIFYIPLHLMDRTHKDRLLEILIFARPLKSGMSWIKRRRCSPDTASRSEAEDTRVPAVVQRYLPNHVRTASKVVFTGGRLCCNKLNS